MIYSNCSNFFFDTIVAKWSIALNMSPSDAMFNCEYCAQLISWKKPSAVHSSVTLSNNVFAQNTWLDASCSSKIEGSPLSLSVTNKIAHACCNCNRTIFPPKSRRSIPLSVSSFNHKRSNAAVAWAWPALILSITPFRKAPKHIHASSRSWQCHS